MRGEELDAVLVRQVEESSPETIKLSFFGGDDLGLGLGFEELSGPPPF